MSKKNTCKPRKGNKVTKAEKRLSKRIEAYNADVRILGLGSVSARASGYHRPGSLQSS